MRLCSLVACGCERAGLQEQVQHGCANLTWASIELLELLCDHRMLCKADWAAIAGALRDNRLGAAAVLSMVLLKEQDDMSTCAVQHGASMQWR